MDILDGENKKQEKQDETNFKIRWLSNSKYIGN